ncbi:MAG: Eco57I restriction-modification methylase domain-containing protein, partial [Edaphobacter sp.]
ADFVIGNPPYVRLEDIPEATATHYRDIYLTMRGRADLYIGFYEAALRQLRQGGVCAFICADRWMRNQYGSELRKLITSSFAVDVVIEMHNADAFHDEVDAYPAIAVIRRQPQASAIVASAGPGAAQANPQEILQALGACRENQIAALPRGITMARVSNWFEGAAPWPCTSPEQLALLRRIEDQFPALETNARVGIGVATGNDRIFITKDSNLVESSRLLKLALAGDLTNGRMEWSGHYLVDPWDEKGLVSLEKFPKLRSYFETHATALCKRHVARNAGNAWFKTIDRVTHALAAQPKLYIPDIKSTLSPVLDSGETYPHHNLYFIQSDVWDLEVLGGLLMSAVAQFFVESYGVRMRGGYLRFQAQYLRRVRLPTPEALSARQTEQFREAFKTHNKELATVVALEVYDIKSSELERVFGH